MYEWTISYSYHYTIFFANIKVLFPVFFMSVTELALMHR